MEVEGDRIANVATGVSAPPQDATRLDGLTIPGLANAHSHAFQRAIRGRTHSGRGDFWSWREAMYELASRLDPDLYLALARATYGEMALAGITCVGEFHYLHHAPDGTPYDDPNAMGRAGDRTPRARPGSASPCSTPATCTAASAGARRSPAALRRRGRRDLGGTRRRARARRRCPDRCGDPQRPRRRSGRGREVAAWAAERNAPLHAHVSEQPAENEAAPRRATEAPRPLFSPTRCLGGRFTAVHAHAPRPSRLRTRWARAATCCVCPTTERDLADGIGPAARLAPRASRWRSVRDSHAVIDLFEEARASSSTSGWSTGARGRTPAGTLLQAATDGGPSLPRMARCRADRARGDGRPRHRGPRLGPAGRDGRGRAPSALLVFAATAADVSACDRRRPGDRQGGKARGPRCPGGAREGDPGGWP